MATIKDVFMYSDDEKRTMSLWQEYGEDASAISYYYVATKPTTNIRDFGEYGDIHLYYVEDENNLFAYGDLDGSGESKWFTLSELYSGVPFIGVIGSVDEVTESGFYVLMETEVVEETPTATITYNGSTIASLFGGQTATLKCAGMKMESDVVVDVAELPEGGGSDANIVPLIVGDVGTYDANSPVIVTETFTGEGEPDAVYNYWGTQLPYFKAKKLVATRDILALANDETLADKLYVDLFGDVTPIWQFEQNTNFTDTSFVIMSRGMPAILWVIATDENYFTQEAGFEDGGVYVLDAWSLIGAAGNASVSALGIPDKPTDGFMPVTVSLPIEDELVIDIDRYISLTGTINDGILYRKVTIDGVKPVQLTITPTNQEQIFYRESDTFFSKITVEPIDISDLSKQKVLCGIYIDPLPKTEYTVGEWLDVSGSVMVRQYTNGETERVSLSPTYVFGFAEIAQVVGTHKLTVQYTENGVTSETVFWVTITE